VIALARATEVLDAALQRRAYSAVAAEVGRLSRPEWRHANGRLAYEHPAAVTHDTIFDLASLTKVIATTTLALGLVAKGKLELSTPVAELLPSWSAHDRASVTVRDLFEHASGLPAHRPYFRTAAGRMAFEGEIAREPLEYAPRTASVYSDLGFILLGFILEDVAHQPLDEQFRQWSASAGIRAPLDFGVLPEWRERIAFTESDPWRRRLLQGEVHDENAAALGGVAGHAGLFGTAAAVGEFARWWLGLLAGEHGHNATASLARVFVMRSSVPASSRAIGWDTMLPTSSCGTRLSPRAIGHTGFTGTSLWIDPARDLYAVLLTNRVHPTRDNDHIQQVRRDFHDAVVDDLDEEIHTSHK
jgi:CubicO group peptidase (beta-lactamase class C family)